MDAVLLLAALSDIRRTLVGSLVRGVDAAGPHGLWVDLATSQGPEGLLLSAEAALPRIVRGAARPFKTRPLPPLAGAARQRLPGTRLTDVTHRGLDRVVRLDFEPVFGTGPKEMQTGPGCRLILELFGNQPNLILTDAEGMILEAARHAPAARILERHVLQISGCALRFESLRPSSYYPGEVRECPVLSTARDLTRLRMNGHQSAA